ncbi:nuclear transport factor 2 family protein [Solitalea sp. MAHUQ-68]|uniref:Nuclear transport factor 2 family protein n=1 Tax=Solitalea agri TaxID=2953739 RepID=A0A9X2F3G3_9SPHI|nr:nuclear transport factor 2 family protein [Solitalea agri]MCO4293465.1 nuclear transport factor 2 family protein [Solitalea agri]
MKRLCLLVFSLMCFTVTNAQSKEEALDKVIKQLYSAISGPAAQQRDTALIRSLFTADARLMPVFANKEQKIGVRVLSVDQYLNGLSRLTKDQGFFEKELSRKIDVYGNIAQVFSTYQSFHNLEDEKPFQRGINSLQLMYDGQTWKILNITWNAETPENPIPGRYLVN